MSGEFTKELNVSNLVSLLQMLDEFPISGHFLSKEDSFVYFVFCPVTKYNCKIHTILLSKIMERLSGLIN